ncbi:2-oxo-4-hydroxy-4-carboxy-5-ureidoimidazoline decarboxylase [Actinocorallia lasiicapitis]
MTLEEFNALTAAEAEQSLLACCAAPQWAAAVAAGRPYGDYSALTNRSDQALSGLGWPQINKALDAHPRIGERAAGTSREAAWSRQEQSGAADADRAAFVEANRAYEDRFGHVFLICATGRSAAEMLEAARARLGNAAETERGVVRGELTAITRLRLGKLIT